MKLNLTQALTLATGSAAIIQGADANHDGHVSGTEVAAAVAQELQLAIVTVPELANLAHSDPARLQAGAAKIAEGLQIIAGGPIA